MPPFITIDRRVLLVAAMGLAVLSAPAQDDEDRTRRRRRRRHREPEEGRIQPNGDRREQALHRCDDPLRGKGKGTGRCVRQVVPLARKALQFEEKEDAWKGKLAVYYPARGSDFKTFIRTVVVSQPEGVHYALRPDEPFLVDPVEVPAKATEADQFANSAAASWRERT